MAQLQPEVIFSVGNFEVTNTLITTFLVDAVLLFIVFKVNKNVSQVPKGIQTIVEPILEGLYSFAEQISGKYVKSIFPWFASFFIFILISNLMGLLPGFGSIGFFEPVHHETTQESAHTPAQDTHTETSHQTDESTTIAHDGESTHSETIPVKEHPTTPEEKSTDQAHAPTTEPETHLVPLFRAVTSDFNATFALATISIVATHVLAIKFNGLKGYLGKFFSLNPILLFVGLLELISEITKLFSLSFRLFGNIYAGEVVLATISDLFAFIAPIPFLLLETIVALVQALVFSLLTMVFMSILITPHHSDEH